MSFTINNQDVSNPVEIANHSCDYFTNIGPNLANKITVSSSIYQTYLSDNFMNPIFFEPATETEVIALLICYVQRQLLVLMGFLLGLLKKS
jgi:hypothetical protein